jgi:Outer membrane protein Omp28
MKAILKAGLLIFAVVALQACDKVSPPYKENIPVPPPPTDVVRKKVLVEDYTGHKCGNCPRASRAIYDQKPIYGDNLIILAIHAGSFAEVFPAGAPYYTYDFRTPEGTELDTDFGISLAGNPNGMVNRRQVDGSYIIGATKWSSEAANVLNDTTEAAVKITIENNFDLASRVLQTEVQSQFLTTLTGSYKLCVFMVEDSIVNWQKDYDATPDNVEFYVHREVFRGSMNSTYGEAVTETAENDINTLSYTYTLPLEWDADHFSIIAYVYDEATKEILQVEQVEIE